MHTAAGLAMGSRAGVSAPSQGMAHLNAHRSRALATPPGGSTGGTASGPQEKGWEPTAAWWAWVTYAPALASLGTSTPLESVLDWCLADLREHSCCNMRRLWLQASEPVVPPEVSLSIRKSLCLGRDKSRPAHHTAHDLSGISTAMTKTSSVLSHVACASCKAMTARRR